LITAEQGQPGAHGDGGSPVGVGLEKVASQGHAVEGRDLNPDWFVYLTLL
jgi:hypothetical protein